MGNTFSGGSITSLASFSVGLGHFRWWGTKRAGLHLCWVEKWGKSLSSNKSQVCTSGFGIYFFPYQVLSQEWYNVLELAPCSKNKNFFTIIRKITSFSKKVAIFRKKYNTRKKNSRGLIFHFCCPKIRKLCNHSICQNSFCNFGSKRLKIKPVEFFLRRNPDFRILLDSTS